MTVSEVKAVEGRRKRLKHYLFSLGKDIYRKEDQVVLAVYSQLQVFAVFGITERPFRFEWRTKRIDDQSAEFMRKTGRRYIDLTEPKQSDIDWLNNNLKP